MDLSILYSIGENLSDDKIDIKKTGEAMLLRFSIYL
jgi:hypothetical protein